MKMSYIKLKRSNTDCGNPIFCVVDFEGHFHLQGDSDAKSRWCDRWQLPVLTLRQGPQQELPIKAERLVSYSLAYQGHGQKVSESLIITHTHTLLTPFLLSHMIVTLPLDRI